MSMSCREARRTLWPAEGPRVSDSEIEAALDHAESCPRCRSLLEDDRRMARLISERVPRIRAPQALRERLYAALARERAGSPVRPPARRRGERKWILAAAVLAGVSLGLAGGSIMGRMYSKSPAVEFAEDFLRRAAEEDAMVTSDRKEVASFFAQELGMVATPPAVPGYEVRKAMICLLHGRRGGVVEYEGVAGRVTFYIIPIHRDDGTQNLSGLDARMVPERRGIRQEAEAGERLAVATWHDRDHLHALVGGLPPQRLTEMAPLFACPTRPL